MRDVRKLAWVLVYPSAACAAERSVPCHGDGAPRTATFFLPEAVFAATKMDYDFEIQATGEPTTIRFVRVIKNPKAPALPPIADTAPSRTEASKDRANWARLKTTTRNGLTHMDFSMEILGADKP